MKEKLYAAKFIYIWPKSREKEKEEEEAIRDNLFTAKMKIKFARFFFQMFKNV